MKTKRKQSSSAAMDAIQETAQGMVEAGVIPNNVFADLGFKDADTMLQQSRLTSLLYDKVKGWPLSRLVEVTGLKKAHAQAILDCKLSKASVSDLEMALRLVEKHEDENKVSLTLQQLNDNPNLLRKFREVQAIREDLLAADLSEWTPEQVAEFNRASKVYFRILGCLRM